MKAPSDQCAFSGWMEISGPQLSWEKPKISPTSWAWAVRDSLSPWPPQVSESTSVCRDSVFCPGHSRQNRSPGARPSKGAAPSWKKVVSHGEGGSPVPQGLARGKGESLPFPSFQQCFLFHFLIPLPDLQALLCGQEQTRVLSGPANQRLHRDSQPGGRGLDRHLSGALRKEPGHLILTHCTLCQPPL